MEETEIWTLRSLDVKRCEAGVNLGCLTRENQALLCDRGERTPLRLHSGRLV
jgi:hypothetical protein